MMDDKRQLRRAFEAAIAEFPGGRGRRNAVLLPRAACLAVKLGISEDDFTDAVRDVAPDMGAADIRRAHRTAARIPGIDAGAPFQAYAPTRPRRAQLKPKAFPDRVRELIAAGRDVATLEGLRALPPHPIGTDVSPWAQTIIHMRALFPDGDSIAFIFSGATHEAGVLGRNLMRICDWLRTTCPNPPDRAGELIVPNPFTGAPGETTDGRQSFIAQSCLAAFPHMVIEFDEMPLADQCAFWAGVLRRGTLPLVSLVYSGGKSIHGVVRVGCTGAAAWDAARADMIALYATDPDPRFRADVQSMRPRTGTRLAGVTRADTGRVQALLFVREGAER